MKEDDYRLFPLPVFIVSSKNGRILYSNPLAHRHGFIVSANFYEMIEDKAVFGTFTQKRPLHAQTTVVIEKKAYYVNIDAALTELSGEAVFLVVVKHIQNTSLVNEDSLIAQITDAFLANNKKPVNDFLRITARGTGAFCAALYEKKKARMTLIDEWRERKSLCIPMLSADAEDSPERELMRLKALKRAADVVIAPFQKAHGTEGMLICFFDSTAEETQRNHIDKLAGFYRLLAPDAPDNHMTVLSKGIEAIEQGVAIWDADTKEMLYENKSFREIFGIGTAKQLLNKLLSDENKADKPCIHKIESTGRSYSVMKTKSRFGRRTLMTTVVCDITRFKQAENKLEMLAKTDILTGLNNRRAGLEILQAAYLKCKREHTAITVCFADIDGLKHVNDTYGHGVGDNMIRAVAMILKKHVDGSGEVCRLGGDEFLLILPGVQKPQAMLLASRIQQAVSRTFVTEAQSISVSFGFKEAEFNAKESVYTLINVADSDMYREKRNKA